MTESPVLRGWPIVEVHYPAKVGIDELRVVYDHLGDILKKRESFALIHHATSGLDAGSRRYLATRQKGQASLSAAHLKAEALVTLSPIVRGALTALNWLFSSPHPIRVFAKEADALAWCEAMLLEARAIAS